MSFPPVSRREVETIVASLASEFDHDFPPDAIAILARPEWSGPPELSVQGKTFEIAACESVLAVRDKLSHKKENPLIILTEQTKETLGTDVCARLATGRPRSSDRKDAVLQLFGAVQLDPRLSGNQMVINQLIDAAPSGGYPKITGRVLLEEHAYRTLIDHHLGLTKIVLDESSLLAWLNEPDNRTRVLSAPTQLVDSFFNDRLVMSVSFAPELLAALRGDQRSNTDLVALGVVAGAIMAQHGNNQSAACAAEFKQHIGGRKLAPAVGTQWGEASETVINEMTQRGEDPSLTLAAADTLLRDLDGKELAAASHLLPGGFKATLSSLGSGLLSLLNTEAKPEDILPLLAAVRNHRLANTEIRRTRQAEMGVRLAQWLQTEPSNYVNLNEAGLGYRNSSGWVDYARRVLQNEQDPEPTIAKAYAQLIKRCDERRSQENKEFGRLIEAWDQGETKSILGIEEVLEQVVAPVAATSPVLVLVMDGMGWDVWHQLRADLARRGWYRIVDSGGQVNLPCYTTFPTVTELSRTSLLAGELTAGDQKTEKRKFTDNKSLLRQSNKKKPPRLFHKGDLSRSDGGGIADEVQQVIEDPEQKIVGCVVNAIDDHLLKGDQVRPAWAVDTISPLGHLLERAVSSGRTVVITADHGHVLDVDTEAHVIRGAKERWRPNVGEPSEKEVRVSGPRTLANNGTVLMPWVEQMRYSSGRRNGYHGGATPQEVLVPLDILTTAKDTPKGWDATPHDEPTWWSLGVNPATRKTEQDEAPEIAVRLSDVAESAPQGSLFETPNGVTTEGWIEELLGSELLKLQRAAAGSRAVQDQRLGELLDALQKNGNRLAHEELSAATGIPLARLRGVLASAMKILNIDGYGVLADDGHTIMLDSDLAITQFGLDL